VHFPRICWCRGTAAQTVCPVLRSVAARIRWCSTHGGFQAAASSIRRLLVSRHCRTDISPSKPALCSRKGCSSRVAALSHRQYGNWVKMVPRLQKRSNLRDSFQHLQVNYVHARAGAIITKPAGRYRSSMGPGEQRLQQT
jgi:hypothetical protein